MVLPPELVRNFIKLLYQIKLKEKSGKEGDLISGEIG
jgi:hypothetical protein